MRQENEKIVLGELNESLRKLMMEKSYKVGDFFFDVEKRVLTYKDDSIKLTRKESYLFVLFAANINSFIDRKDLLINIWSEDTYYNSRSMDVYICKLRKLLSKDSKVTIVNIHGKGYKLIVS